MATLPKVNVVWLKRDLRLNDHAPLAELTKSENPSILIYIFDPQLLNAPDSDFRHWRFVWQSLQDIKQQLIKVNGDIHIFHDDSKTVFNQLLAQFDIQNVFSYQETGNAISFERDKLIKQLLQFNQISWKEFQCNGVIRGLSNRNNWDKEWQTFMTAPIDNVDLKNIVFDKTPVNLDYQKSLPEEIFANKSEFQPGGETYAWRYLSTFLNQRNQTYSAHISKPLLSRKSCSRLSPYLAYGNLSMRQVYQMTIMQLGRTGYKRGLINFISRLHWHCHFIQKFESECRIEFENFNRAYDQIVKPRNASFINAFENGTTGIPIIDANIRCLIKTGYTNFRMRAMLVSFFCFNLWQDWRELHFLARQFLDYEPGIHYPQLQMQAGTTGVNTLRIYNPIKNALEHDPEGLFVKQWIPELADVPLPMLHTPWQLSETEQTLFNCKLGIDYPLPIVDIEESQKFATQLMWGFKKNKDAKEEGERILKTHVKSRPMKKKSPKKK